MPISPLDRTNLREARHWILLAASRPFIPPGASVVPVAADRAREMSLFMFAVGLYPENDVRPGTYWTRPVDEGSPDYIIAFGCDSRIGVGALVAEIPYGCVYRGRR